MTAFFFVNRQDRKYHACCHVVKTRWGQHVWCFPSRQLKLLFRSMLLMHFPVCPLGFIMFTQPCSLWPICQTLLAPSICLDLDWIKAPTDKMMARSPPVWRSHHVSPADLLALSHPQANQSQSQGCRGEVSEESQHLIGELHQVRFFFIYIFPHFRWARHCSTFVLPEQLGINLATSNTSIIKRRQPCFCSYNRRPESVFGKQRHCWMAAPFTVCTSFIV